MLADPQALSGASDALRALAAELEDSGREVTASVGSPSASWAGSASLAFGARVADVRRALSGAARELHEVAHATSRFAAEAQEAHCLRRRVEARSSTRSPAMGGPSAAGDGSPAGGGPAVIDGPSARELWPLAALAESDSRLRAHAIELRRVLATSDPCAGLPSAWLEARQRADATADLVSAAPVLAKVGPTVAYWSALPGVVAGSVHGRGPVGLISTVRDGTTPLLTPGMSSAPGAADAGRTGLAGARRARMAQALEGLRGGRPLPGLPDVPAPVLTAARRLSLVTGTIDAARDAVIGDPAHPGWRDVVTRAAGAAGALGGGALLVGVSSPIGAGVAAAAVTGYGLWKLGTAIWDHRHTVGRAWSSVVDATRGMVLRGISRVRLASSGVARQAREVTSHLQDVAGGVRTAAEEVARDAGRVVDRAGEVTAKAWGEAVRSVRSAPDAPFGPG